MTSLRTPIGQSITLPAPIKAGDIYTCPMHPQIRQVGPGTLVKGDLAGIARAIVIRA